MSRERKHSQRPEINATNSHLRQVSPSSFQFHPLLMSTHKLDSSYLVLAFTCRAPLGISSVFNVVS